MKNNNVPAWIAMGFAVVFAAVGGVVCFTLNNQLNSMQTQVQQLQKEGEAKNKEIVELTEKNKQLEDQSTANARELSTRLENIRRLQSNVKVVGECLTGVVNLFDAAAREDSAALIVSLTSLSEPCKRAEGILEEVEKAQTSQTPYPSENYVPSQVSN